MSAYDPKRTLRVMRLASVGSKSRNAMAYGKPVISAPSHRVQIASARGRINLGVSNKQNLPTPFIDRHDVAIRAPVEWMLVNCLVDELTRYRYFNNT